MNYVTLVQPLKYVALNKILQNSLRCCYLFPIIALAAWTFIIQLLLAFRLGFLHLAH